MSDSRLLGGLAPLAARYDVFLLDQFGVLHDGSTPYPGALPCLEALRAAGKRVIVLSNSGTRQQPNVERMARIGIPPELYDEIVTSGEVARSLLADPPPELRRGQGRGPLRCLTLGESARALLAGLDITITEEAAEADFLLVASLSFDPPPRSAFAGVFAEARARNLTLVCANPDVKGVSAAGLIHAPGALAADYAALGGRVVYIGKPHPLIYRHVLDRLSSPVRVLAVGDSLAHDVAGARGAGLASAFVIGGIHEHDLGDPEGPGFAGRLEALEQREGARPDYLLRRLTW
ncbi:MAG TPA: TIGR01459 family HAD-type hydrolase [Kiloniellaceae bacterium]|nr:TIGR01459 family HAD-type hydrolase [Kiloniellaceae bacterium]